MTWTSGMPAGASASTKENENMAMEVGNTFSTSLYTLTVISAKVIRINVSDNIVVHICVCIHIRINYTCVCVCVCVCCMLRRKNSISCRV